MHSSRVTSLDVCLSSKYVLACLFSTALFLAETITVDILISEGGILCEFLDAARLSSFAFADKGGDGIGGMWTDLLVELEALEFAVCEWW